MSDIEELLFNNHQKIRPITEPITEAHNSGQNLIKKEKNKSKKKSKQQQQQQVVDANGKPMKTAKKTKKTKKSKKNAQNSQNLNDSGTIVTDEAQQVSYFTDTLNIEEEEEEHNDTIRWITNGKKESEEDEENRIKIYKINRRKRYIEQRNRILNLTSQLNNNVNANTSLTKTTNRSNTDSAISSLSSNSK